MKDIASNVYAQVLRVDGAATVAIKMKDGERSVRMAMPFTRVVKDREIASIPCSNAELSKLQDRIDQAVTNEMFAQPVRGFDRQTRTDWMKAATALPTDGREPGSAFIAQTRVISAAVETK